MYKNSLYFPHDFNARMDEKILEMRSKYGFEGYGLYWALIELMAEASNYKLSLKRINGIAMAMPYDCQKLTIFIDDCIGKPIELFSSDGECFWSESLLRRMIVMEEGRARKSSAGRKGAKKRWQGHSGANGEAMAEDGIVERVEKSKVYTQDSFEMKIAKHLFNKIQERHPEHKEPDFQKWAKHADLMVRKDERKKEKIKEVIDWCQDSEFWQNNILSTAKLRSQFDQLILKMGGSKKNEPQQKIIE